MKWAYWKVVIKYGRVGRRKEVSVARFLVTPHHATAIEVMKLVEDMPGKKNRATVHLVKIQLKEYLEGKRAEQESFFLQRLFEHSKAE
jgi:hypothetical protein